MSNEDKTDYQPGDAPVAPGTTVVYRDRDYEVVEHQESRPDVPEPEANYPDGVAYVLWPVGVQKKFGNRDQSMVQVRRRSFYVKAED
jgi:hypothetical protein